MIVVIDSGTTTNKLLAVDKDINIIYKDQIELAIKRLPNGEILQNANEILETTKRLLNRFFTRTSTKPENVKAISLTNQRETTIIFDKDGNPIKEAISWQANHTSYITDEWRNKNLTEKVFKKTGLVINPYFSASKIKHLISDLDLEELYFGTLDTFLLYNLTKEKNYCTDITNASRTMIFNIKEEAWDLELINDFGLEGLKLPQVLANDDLFGHYEYNNYLIPIIGVIGDQQSALFGNLCTNYGDTKITYGTGCFILTNTMDKLMYSKHGLLSTIAYKIDNQTKYALEGSVFMGGSAISWIKDKFNFINHASETEKMALESDDESVYVVPAFSGLGAPHWNDKISASILGLKASSTKEDIIKATLNSIAYQVSDIIKVIASDNDILVKEISVDGGAAVNNYLMQFQADLINAKIIKFRETELTALGAAFIAGLKLGVWESLEEIRKIQTIKQIYIPSENRDKYNQLYSKWQKALEVTSLFV